MKLVVTATLRDAIRRYDFPRVAYDFQAQRELVFPSMSLLEQHVGKLLTSGDSAVVKDGLSNVLYWGYARSGYRNYRVEAFRRQVTSQQLASVVPLLAQPSLPTLFEVASLKLPGFSGLSFLSKVLMMIAPREFVVLDLKLAGLRLVSTPNIFHALKFPASGTQVPATPRCIGFYTAWCAFCQDWAEAINDPSLRAVDIERGVYQLLTEGRMDAVLPLLSIETAARFRRAGKAREPDDPALLQKLRDAVDSLIPADQRRVLALVRGMGFDVST